MLRLVYTSSRFFTPSPPCCELQVLKYHKDPTSKAKVLNLQTSQNEQNFEYVVHTWTQTQLLSSLSPTVDCFVATADRRSVTQRPLIVVCVPFFVWEIYDTDMGNFRKRNNDLQIIVTALPIHEIIFPSKIVHTLQGFQIFATVVDLTIVK